MVESLGERAQDAGVVGVSDQHLAKDLLRTAVIAEGGTRKALLTCSG